MAGEEQAAQNDTSAAGDNSTSTENTDSTASENTNDSGAEDNQQSEGNVLGSDGSSEGGNAQEKDKADDSSDEGAEGDKSDDDSSDDDAEGAPEEYGDFDIPQGMTVDDAQMGEFKDWAKDQNLSQKGAQGAIDMFTRFQKSQADSYHAQVQQWAEDCQNDKEFGGEAFEENKASANKALKEFGSEKFTQLLLDSGYANHPEVVRTFVNIGKRLGEGDAKRSTQNAGKSKRPADVWYNNSN